MACMFQDFKPSAEKEYTLQVEKEGFESIEATTSIQTKVPISKLEYDTTRENIGYYCENDSCFDYYSTTYKFRLKLKDPAGMANFYTLSGYQKFNDTLYHYDDSGNYHVDTVIISAFPLTFYTEDPVFTDLEFNFDDNGYNSEDLIFTDEIFSGKEYTINFELQNFINRNILRITLELKTMNEAQYQYLRSKKLQEENVDNPFAEPVTGLQQYSAWLWYFCGLQFGHDLNKFK